MFNLNVTNLFDLFDVEVETMKTVPDFEDLINKVDGSIVSTLYNTLFLGVLTECLQAGWEDRNESLGEYLTKIAQVFEEVRDLAGASGDDYMTAKEFADNQDIIELLNKYGAAHKRDEGVPVLVFRDKKTGEVIGEDVDKIFGAGVVAAGMINDLMKEES